MNKSKHIDDVDFSVKGRKKLLHEAKEAECSSSPLISQAEAEALILEYFESAEKIARKLLRSWQVQLEADEIKSIVGLALSEAALRFDPSKNVAFVTFLFYHLRGSLIKEISRLAKHSREVRSLGISGGGVLEQDTAAKGTMEADALSHDNNPENVLYKDQLEVFFKEVCKLLDDLEKEVVFRHLIEDQPLNVVASELKYSRFYISRVKKRAVAKLQKVLLENTLLLDLIFNMEERTAILNK